MLPVFHKRLFFLLMWAALGSASIARAPKPQTLTIVSFNASLNRETAGELIRDLQTKDNPQAKNVAEILQRLRPDVVALLEFDYDPEGKAWQLFHDNYLMVSQNGQEPLRLEHAFVPPVNTGVPSGKDLDNDGKTDTPNDAYGFGKHPGQYGFVIASRFPIQRDQIRTFQQFLWKDMPNAALPQLPETGKPYFTEESLSAFRLSSKNHVDVPIQIGKKTLHVLVAHPTPPVFDGPEDRNGRRNHDEIRLLADYLSGGEKAAYLTDDQGRKGGLREGESFVILGDMNADPEDGDSYQRAIWQLLSHPKVSPTAATGGLVPQSEAGAANSAKSERLSKQKGNPAHDTAFWGLRADYILPSSNCTVLESGIFWPMPNDPLSRLVGDKASSDHLPVWLKMTWGKQKR